MSLRAGVNFKFYCFDVDKTTFDFGTLRIEKDGREYVFDTSCGLMVKGNLDVNVFLFDMPDEDIAAHSKQDLKGDDLYNPDVAELFIGEMYDEEPESMTLFVRFTTKSGNCSVKGIELT